jgi:hypothetical protein
MLDNSRAAKSAKSLARVNLLRALDEAIEPVHCPRCGIYQPAMVRALRERHGKQFDPNKYAFARIAYPAADLWCTARAMNTKEAYITFMEVWPTLDKQAKHQLKQIRYPPPVCEKSYRAFFGSHGALWLRSWSAQLLSERFGTASKRISAGVK